LSGSFSQDFGEKLAFGFSNDLSPPPFVPLSKVFWRNVAVVAGREHGSVAPKSDSACFLPDEEAVLQELLGGASVIIPDGKTDLPVGAYALRWEGVSEVLESSISRDLRPNRLI
jgi:hypothetical protein